MLPKGPLHFSTNAILNGVMRKRSVVMPLETDAEIRQLLTHARTVAVVGASINSSRPSHRVMQFLLNEGYQVFPVNPALAGSQLLGQRVLPDLASIPQSVDIVDVFRQARFLSGVVEEAIAIAANAVWGQLGVVDLAAAKRAEEAGLQVVMNRCPAIEIPRLGISRSSPGSKG